MDLWHNSIYFILNFLNYFFDRIEYIEYIYRINIFQYCSKSIVKKNGILQYVIVINILIDSSVFSKRNIISTIYQLRFKIQEVIQEANIDNNLYFVI